MPSERIQRQIDRLLDEAEAAAGLEDWSRVADRARMVLGLDEQNQDATAFLSLAARADASAPGSSVGAETVRRFQEHLPASFAGGRYSVRRFLGEGAKKRVYLAHDTRLDRDVAFALIKTEGLDADGLVRVRREAQAMARLGDHPNIVTIFDSGDEAGAPYIVSQYQAGGSIEHLLAHAEDRRISSDRAMEMAEQICRALQHAHSRDIVHRDLKPGNVWLNENGEAALGDFGLAVALDRSRMTMAGTMVGTVAYIAPEQALGQPPDARSDLYSLGAMLYEMVAGRPPFLGEETVGVISQHINTAPVAPSWHTPAMPRPLEALILQLLAKSPGDRPSSAEHVAIELRRIRDLSTETEHPPGGQAAVVTDLRRLDWGRFVGRAEEMQRLKEALESTLSGTTTIVLLAGEPGIGKTRLAEEFGVYAGLRGAQVLAGRCYEGEQAVPYRPLIDAMRQYVRSQPDGDLRQQLGTGAQDVAGMVSEIRQRFPDVGEPPKLEADAERIRLFDSITAFLHNASQSQPLVIFVDDLHWSDKPSLLLLQHLSRHAGGGRLLILATYRDEELDRLHPLSGTLMELRRLPNVVRLPLKGLAEECVSDLLTAFEPSEESAASRRALAHALHSDTEGNPFFIREVLSHLVEEGRLVREGGRWVGRVASVSELGIPEGVREVVGRRLSRLTEPCGRLLTRASTMTRGFDWDALRAISADVPESELLDLLDEALAAQLVAERRGDGTTTYDFTHALIRHALYEELSGPRRVLLHREVGIALEKLWATQLDAHVGELAYHFYQAAPGGDLARAIDYCLRAGDRAEAMHGYEDAIAHYERALQATEMSSGADGAKRCELLLRRGVSSWNAGLYEDARCTFEQAYALASDAGTAHQVALAALGYGGLFAGFGAGVVDATLISMLESALERLDDTGPLTARVSARLAAALRFSREDEQRRFLAARALELAQSIDDPRVVARVMIDVHWAIWGPDNPEERIALLSQAMRLAEETQDLSAELEIRLWSLSDSLEIDGANHVSSGPVTEFYESASRLRQPYHLWFVQTWQAMRAHVQGQFAESERLATEALQMAGSENQNAVQLFAVQIASIRREQGRLAELAASMDDFIASYPGLPAWSCARAMNYMELNHAEDARAEFERHASSEFAELPRDLFWITSLTLLAEVCAFLGDRPRAEALYEKLSPYAHRHVAVGTAAACYGSVSRYLGQLATTLERWDIAERHFQRALSADKIEIAPVWNAWTHFHYAYMLLARAEAGDRQSALAHLAQALALGQDLGMTSLLDKGIALQVRAQETSTVDIFTSIDAVTVAVERERPHMEVPLLPDGTVTIMFSDVEASTELAARLGDRAWHELLRAHNRLIREQISLFGGYEVKTLGDGFMVAFQSALRGVECAVAIQRAFERRNPSPDQPLRVRIGLHAGEAIKDEEDFFGTSVILASRIASQAKGGEILVSSLLKQLVDGTGTIMDFDNPRYVDLKGFDTLQTVVGVRWTMARTDA